MRACITFARALITLSLFACYFLPQQLFGQATITGQVWISPRIHVTYPVLVTIKAKAGLNTALGTKLGLLVDGVAGASVTLATGSALQADPYSVGTAPVANAMLVSHAIATVATVKIAAFENLIAVLPSG